MLKKCDKAPNATIFLQSTGLEGVGHLGHGDGIGMDPLGDLRLKITRRIIVDHNGPLGPVDADYW